MSGIMGVITTGIMRPIMRPITRPLVMVCLSMTFVAGGLAPETDRLVVTFFDAEAAARAALEVKNVSVMKQYGRRLVLWLPYAVTLERDGANVEDMIDRVMGRGLVEGIELDHKVAVSQVGLIEEESITVSPIDYPEMGVNYDLISGLPQERPMWNIDAGEAYGIRAEPVWQITNSTPGVVVAVVDSGLAEAGQDAFLNIGAGYDFISDPILSLDEDGRDPDPTDPGDYGPACPISSWHGTRVASILAARHDSVYTLGMRGVAQNLTLLPVRVLGECRTGYASDVADAIVWAAGGNIIGVGNVSDPARIIAMSFSGQGDCPGYLQSAVTQAAGLGALLVVAAGNQGVDAGQFFPGNCKGTLVVGASTRSGALASYSNFGDSVDVAAPGGDYRDAIMTLGVDQSGWKLQVAFGVGTSFAVPHVAGVAALGVSRGWDAGRLRSALSATAQKFNGSCVGCGDGIVDADFIAGLAQINYTSTKIYQGLGVNQSGVSVTADYYSQPCLTGYYVNTGAPTTKGSTFWNCGLSQWICNVLVFVNGANQVMNVGLTCCDMSGTLITASSIVISSSGNFTNYYSLLFFNPITQFSLDGNGYKIIGGSNSGALGDNGASVSGSCSGSAVATGVTYATSNVINSMVPNCNSLCLPCAAGKSTSGPYVTTCSNCNSGWITTSAGQSCVPCNAGSYCPPGASVMSTCTSGNYCPQGAAGQSPCNAGYYCPNTGMTAPTPCNNGYYCPSTGASVLTACPLGSYCPATGALSAPTPCNAGYYCPNTKMADYTSFACNAGYFCATSGQSAMSGCTAGNYCPATGALTGQTQCNAGYYCPSAQMSAPTPCNNGYYCPSSGATVRTSCPKGSYCPATGALVASTPCNVGYYCPTQNMADYTSFACNNGYFCATSGQSAMTPCNAGYYCPNSGALSASSQCVAGTYCPAGSSAAINCNSGYYCQSQGAVAPTQCTAGNYCPAVGALTSQTQCNNGYYCPAGSSAPTACPQGTYGGGTGKSAVSDCISCPVGTVSGTLGLTLASGCQACTAGTFSDKAGGTVCQTCTQQSCGSNMYLRSCTATMDAACVDCTLTVSIPVNAGFTSLTDPKCPYTCNVGFTQDSSGACCVNCNVGQYYTGCSLSASGTCVGCNNNS